MIEITARINATLSEVWDKWIDVDSVEHWAFANDDWAAKGIENDVVVGGKIRSRNFAKDGSMEFELSGTYTDIIPFQKLAYMLDDNRTVEIIFSEDENVVLLKQSFEPEKDNDEDFQKAGWQAYLDNFKKYVESS